MKMRKKKENMKVYDLLHRNIMYIYVYRVNDDRVNEQMTWDEATVGRAEERGSIPLEDSSHKAAKANHKTNH